MDTHEHGSMIASGPVEETALRAEPPVRKARRRWPLTLAVAGLGLLLAVGGFLAGRAGTPDDQPLPAPTQVSLPVGEEPVAAVAAALTPAIVQIETGGGIGSGIVYDETGLILTAAHVVGSSSGVAVQLANGDTVEGQVVGADPVSDIAVIRIEAVDLVAAPLASGVELQPGQMAIAIGSPFGLDQTVTAGVISSVARAVPGSDGVVRQLIQTDAPINPGNSGGALADRQGRVIGVNDQIFSRSGGNEGVGFAVPIDQAKDVADRIVAGQPLATARLGVSGADPTIGQAGALVTDVQPGSAAARAGLEPGDLIVGLDGAVVESFTDLAGMMRTHRPGDIVGMVIDRDGQRIELEVTLGE
jgi:S1-C subfamily serine protease